MTDLIDPENPEYRADQPVLAVVGRPNVGKSTLVNRILGRREAVVEDVPGVTRDRVAYDAQWRGRRFTIVDTGGWDPDAVGLQKAVAAQAEIAVSAADAVLFVVDATIGATDSDEAVVRVLRKARKPVVLVANKVDDERAEADAATLWSLGLGEPYTVSALHGRGSGDLLDVILDALPETPAERFDTEDGPRRVALVGRPNVGKSTLFNRLVGERLAIVEDLPGTTRDRLYGAVEWRGREFSLVDTGGLDEVPGPRATDAVGGIAGLEDAVRRQADVAIDEADLVLFIVDAKDGILPIEQELADRLRRSGKPTLLVANKADGWRGEAQAAEFYQLGLGELYTVSAIQGHGTGDLLDAIIGRLPDDEVVAET
ncbi:MAG: 50S ribosome-binding GTPase, partial [Actinomycetota bacterium]|nr:50S ribosome-binding GTPase [Actinomycetota bacterium]